VPDVGPALYGSVERLAARTGALHGAKTAGRPAADVIAALADAHRGQLDWEGRRRHRLCRGSSTQTLAFRSRPARLDDIDASAAILAATSTNDMFLAGLALAVSGWSVEHGGSAYEVDSVPFVVPVNVRSAKEGGPVRQQNGVRRYLGAGRHGHGLVATVRHRRSHKVVEVAPHRTAIRDRLGRTPAGILQLGQLIVAEPQRAGNEDRLLRHRPRAAKDSTICTAGGGPRCRNAGVHIRLIFDDPEEGVERLGLSRAAATTASTAGGESN
jgi:hypothetical protein